MTRKTSSNRSTTLDSLLNTLARFLAWLVSRNEHWLLKRDEAIAQQREYGRQKKWDKEARRDWDIAHERVTFSEGLRTVETLVSDLIIVLEGNPYPGEYKRVLDIAQELFPEAKVMLYPKCFMKGERLWIEIFEIGGVEHRDRLRFPVKDGEIDIGEIEQSLYELVREDGTIVAAKVPAVLNLNPNGKPYRVVKSKLQERNWVWRQRREGGKVVGIVVPPA